MIFQDIKITIKKNIKRYYLMALTAEKKLINFQSEKSLVEEAKEVLASQNMTMTQALNLFLKNIVVTGEIGLKSEEEL
ncbi:hypothetical protein ACTGU6_11265, partial [Streptococcus suis]